jgi:transglutaminase-like putative cysteine protease
MKYTITHITKYVYGDVVPLSHNLVHLQPRETNRQSMLASEIDITPLPAARHDRVDFFGNLYTWFSIQEPHDSLLVESRSEVEVGPFTPPDNTTGGPWDAAPADIRSGLDPATLDAGQYAFDSPYITRDNELADYARPDFPPGRPLLECVTALTLRINKEFIFDKTATSVGTPILDVLRSRRGVCQDFAHLQIGCLRSLGLAARYVSGYLVTRPPPGQPKLAGVDASHAWVAAYFPRYGWIDFDPTNGLIPSDEHITLGWARDYEDIGPVKGVIVGGHRHSVRVSVDVQSLSARSVVEPAPAA